jgi:hypothetical protein
MSANGPGAGWMPPGTGMGTGRTNGATAPPVSGDLWQWVDPALLPPRPWLLGTVLMRGHTTLLGSPGGTGKTAWAVAAALAAITGRKNILGLHSFVRGSVWFVTLEDDKAEMQRRIAAAMMQHGVGAGDIAGRLYLTDGVLKLVEYSHSGRTAQFTPSVEDCKDFIRDNNILLTIIDPLVKAHSVDGSSNDAMDVLISASNEIARDTQCSMLVPCHFRKGGDLDTDGRDLFRGATSLVDGARIARGMQQMTDAEAKGFGMADDRRTAFVRMVDIKSNMAPKAQATDWYELVPIALGNDRVDPAYTAGDSVQAIKRWDPPELFGGMDHPTMAAIFSRLGDASQTFHATAGGGRNWAGTVIMAEAGKSREQAKDILRLWIDSGTLIDLTYKNTSGEERHKLVPDPAKVAAILSDMATHTPGP